MVAVSDADEDNAITRSFGGDDVDSDDDTASLSYSIVDDLAPGDGSVVTNPDGTFTFNPGADFDDLAPGESRQVSFTYQATDSHSATSGPETVTLTVDGINDAPDVALAAAAFVEGGGPVAISPSIQVTDVDDANLESVTITLTNPQSGDALSVAGALPAGISANVTTNQIVLSGSALLADYETAIAQVRFDNDSGDPDPTDRILEVVASDGLDADSTFNTITVAPMNNPPDLTVPAATLDYTENDAPQIVNGGIVLDDVDDTELVGATVSITANLDPNDVLAFADTPEIGGSFNAGVLTLSGNATVAQYQAALRAVTFENTGDDPSAADRTIAFQAFDAVAGSTVGESTVAVTRVNDAPGVDLDDDAAGTGFATTFTEDGGPIAIADDVLITDPDNPTLNQVTVTLTNPQAGDALSVAGALPGGITATISADQVVLDGIATPAEYQAAIAEVRFDNPSQDPSAIDRTVTVIATDGDGLAGDPAVATIAVQPVNDAPVVDLDADGPAPFQTAFTENGGPIAISDVDVLITDADDADLVSVTITLTNPQSNDSLSVDGALPAGISANVTASQIILNGSAPLADYQTAIGQIRFDNPSDDPDSTARQITVVADDGDDSSPAVASVISIVVDDDPPALTTNAGATVTEGGVVALSAALLEVSDPGTANANITFTVIDAGDGEVRVSGVPAASFTQAQLAAGVVSFAHDGSETPATSVSFTVTDGTTPIGPASFDLAVTPVDDAPVISTNVGATVAEGAEVTLTAALLTVSDADTAAADIIYAVTDAGAGEVRVGGIAVASFTQADLNAGLISYAHDGSEAPATSFSFTVTDGTTTLAAASFDITIDPAVDDPPEITTNAGATVAEGGVVALSATLLAVTDPDTAAADIVYTVTDAGAGEVRVNGIPATNFTQAELNGGLVSYAHDGSDGSTTGFSFTVSDDTTTLAAASFDITVTADDDPPEITTNTGATVAEGGEFFLSAASLDVTDPDTADGNITYTVSDAGAGEIRVGGVGTTSFTQAELNAGLISYAHDGSEAPATSFSFTVTDGTTTLAAASFDITIDPAVDDPPEITTNAGATVTEGGEVVLGATVLAATDPDTADVDIIYTVNDAGASEVRVGGIAATNFTQAELIGGLVSYAHDGSPGTATSISFTVSDGTTTLPPASFAFTVEALTGDPPSVLLSACSLDIALEVATPVFPDVGEGASIDPADVQGVIPADLIITEEGSITVTFASENAGFRSTLGFYKIAPDGTITDPEIIFENASEAGSGGSLQPGISSVVLAGLAVGDQIGFFLIANGSTLNDDYAGIDFGTSTLEFRNGIGDPAKVTDATPTFHVVPSGGGPEVELEGNIFHTRAFESATLGLNPDGIQHAISGADSATGEMQIGFEDLLGGGDADYQDVIFRVDPVPNDVELLPATTLDPGLIVQSPDALPLIQAVISIDGALAGDRLALDENLFTILNGDIDGTPLSIVGDGTDTIMLTGEASAAQYQDVLRAIRFENPVRNSDTGARDVTFSATDLEGKTSAEATLSVTVTEPNPCAPCAPCAPALIVGTEGDDDLVGDGDDEILVGGSGDDQLFGNGGVDALIGGVGIDELTGGTGADRFEFRTLAEISADLAGADTVTDFASGTDSFVFDGAVFADAIKTGTSDEIAFAVVDNSDGTAPYDGTGGDGTGGSSGLDQAGFVYEITADGGILYYDSDPVDPGYTVVAAVQGDQVTADDIKIE